MLNKDIPTETELDQAAPADMPAIPEEDTSPNSQLESNSPSGEEKAPGIQGESAEETPISQTDFDSDGIPPAQETEGANESLDSQTEPNNTEDEHLGPEDNADPQANNADNRMDKSVSNERLISAVETSISLSAAFLVLFSAPTRAGIVAANFWFLPANRLGRSIKIKLILILKPRGGQPFLAKSFHPLI